MPSVPAVIKDLGPCGFDWDGGTELSPMFGSVVLKSEQLTAPIKEDGQGDVEIDSVTIGVQGSMEITMTRSTLTQLSKVVHGSTLTGTAQLEVENQVGEALFASAKEVLIKPMVNNVVSVTNTEWITVFKAYPIHKFEITWDNATQRVFVVEFKIYPDTTSGNVGKLWKLGYSA